jgi:phospholipid transport system substrate-binding protein
LGKLRERNRKMKRTTDGGIMKKSILIALIVVLLPLPAFGQEALEAVKKNIDDVLSVLKDEEMSKEAKRTRIESIARENFDFTELSRRTLALNWKKLNVEQQREFVDLYRTLLEQTYANRILSYTNEKIHVTREIPLSKKAVEVRSTVSTKTGEVPINYRVMQKDGDWKIYDVVIEGVSLIGNYRSQFREIMSRGSAESLLESLRRKVGKA